MSSSFLKILDKSIQLYLKVLPNAPKTEIVCVREQRLFIKLNATPEKGKANHKLIAFLSKQLKLPKSAFSLIQGECSSKKMIEILADPSKTAEKIYALLA